MKKTVLFFLMLFCLLFATACGTEAPAEHTHTPSGEATCTEAAVCTGCGEVLEAAKGHSYDDGTVTPAACTTKGFTTHTCTACGDTKTDSETAALGHSFDSGVITKRATPFVKGEKTLTCQKCGDTKVESLPTSIKILAVGNSFSVDAMQYLWDILNHAGVEEIILGNLYIGGCSLNTHYANATSAEESALTAYTYYKNTAGTWNNTPSGIEAGIADEDWDIITLQQASQLAGDAASYTNLQPLIDYVKERKPDHCKLYWHMTWAYQKDSTHSGFAKYGNNQATMYQSIQSVMQSTVIPNADFAGIIPVGTSVQNLRTSYFGDTLTRDGYHLTTTDGRYLAGLTWFAALTGGDVSKITWKPDSVRAEDIPAIREAVANAIRTPYAVTDSLYPPEIPTPPDVPVGEPVTTAVASAAELTAAWNAALADTEHPHIIRLTASITMTGALNAVTAGADITLDLNGRP